MALGAFGGLALGASSGTVLRHIVGDGLLDASRYVDYKQLGTEPLDPAICRRGRRPRWAFLRCWPYSPRRGARRASDPVQALREG